MIHYFYNIGRKTTIQFLDLFNNIKVARFDKATGDIIKYVDVPIRFAPKTKQWYWNEWKDNGQRKEGVFPMIGVNLVNVEYDNERQVNRHYKLKYKELDNVTEHVLNPVPYNYQFQVQIISEYMYDLMQIIEQILPMFKPEAHIRISIPEIDAVEVDGEAQGIDKIEMRTIYEGMDMDAAIEIDEADFRVLSATMTFTVHSFLFERNSTSAPIHQIVQSYYLTDEAFDSRDSSDEIGDMTSSQVEVVTKLPDGQPIQGGVVDDTLRELAIYEEMVKG